MVAFFPLLRHYGVLIANSLHESAHMDNSKWLGKLKLLGKGLVITHFSI